MNELEERARTLLKSAADTIDVPPGVAPFGQRRPVWPWLAAAAAVALVVVGLPVLLSGADRGVRPQPVAPTKVTVPQTYLMTTEQAEGTLRSAGLEVRLGTSGMNECELPEDRVVRSEPAAGTVVEPGTPIRIDRPGGSEGGFCVTSRWDLVVDLLDLARFGENRLDFAPTVRLWRRGDVTATLTAEQAATGEWGERSPLDTLVAAVADTRPFGPVVTNRLDLGGQFGCGPQDPPPGLTGRRSRLVMVGDRVDGQFGCTWLRVYRDRSRAITDVVSATSIDY